MRESQVEKYVFLEDFPTVVITAGNFVQVMEMATKFSGIPAEIFPVENPQQKLVL